MKNKRIYIFLMISILGVQAPLYPADQIVLSSLESQLLAQDEVIIRDLSLPGQKVKTFEAVTIIQASRQQIVDVILDFESYPDFMPNVNQVDEVGKDSDGVHLNITLGLPLGISKKYRIALTEAGQNEQFSKIAWHSLEWPGLKPSETIKETNGYWLVQEKSDTSAVVLYHVRTDPGPVPWGFGWVVDLLTQNNLPDILLQTGIQAKARPIHSKTKRVLFVVTSNNQMGPNGKETGYYFSEVTHPYFQIIDAGFEVDIASPKGGHAPMEERSLKLKDSVNQRFYENPSHMAKLEHTLLLEDIQSDDYSAILFVGGHGGMWDFPANEEINRLAAGIYEKGGVTAAVCHGPAALVDVKLSDDSYLVAGKTLTAFTNAEEEVKNLSDVMPFLLESKLIERGALFTKASVWQEKVVVSDRLVTGQNPASAEAVGQAIVQLLKTP